MTLEVNSQKFAEKNGHENRKCVHYDNPDENLFTTMMVKPIESILFRWLTNS